MANSTEEEQKILKQEQQNPQIEPNKQAPKKSVPYCKSKFIFTGFTFVIAVSGIVLALYTLQQNKQIQTSLADENRYLVNEVNELKQQQTSNQERQVQLDLKSATLEKTQTTLQNKIDNLNKDLQTALSQRLYQNQDWLILKARYFLELAQINAHWSDNFNTTIELLNQGDKLLQSINSPKILPIREAIAKEIAMLKAIPTIDLPGILSQLDAAQTSVGNLNLQSNTNEAPLINESETQHSVRSSSWHNNLANSISLLKKLVVIRRNDEDIKPLMSPLYIAILKENIRLNLQEAQWAVLNNNSDVYQLALKQAILNIQRAFSKQDSNTAALLTQLGDLQAIRLSQEKPAPGPALPLLNQLIDSKESSDSELTKIGKGVK